MNFITVWQNWQKPKPIESRRVNNNNSVPVEIVRDEMESKIERNIETGMLIVSVPAGVGKSFTAKYVSEMLADIHGLKIAWFGTRHNAYDSLERNDEWTQIYGRYGDNYSKNGELLENGNCDFAGLCHAVGQKGYSSAITICPPKDESKRKPNVWKCQIARDNCDFWQQFETNSHWFMPGEHIPACKLWSERNRLVVLDEIDSHSLVPSPIKIDIPMINSWIKKHPKAENYLSVLKGFLANVDGAVSDKELHQALVNIFPWIDMIAFEYDFFENDIYDIQTEDDIHNLPDSRCKDFLIALTDELVRFHNKKPVISRIVVHPGYYVFYPKLDLTKQFIDIHNEYRTLKELPSVLLNATADVSGLKHLLADENYHVDVYSPHVALCPETEVVYDLSRNNAKSAVNRRQAYYDRWISQIRDYVGNTKTLVVCTMDGERLLKNGLADLVESGLIELAHYGNVSGLNRYEDFSQIILAQPFQPSPMAVAQRFRQIYGGIEGSPLDLSTCYQDAIIDDGNMAYEVSVRTMTDSRLRLIYEDWRNAEHYQAAHRVRPILHKRKIYILFAIPVEGLEATSIVYEDSKGGRPSKYNELEQAAIDLIDTKGYFTQADLKDCGFSHGYVVKYWQKLADELDLHEEKRLVPNKRYPKGRSKKTLVKVVEQEYPKGKLHFNPVIGQMELT